ncbi:hypothetical protein K474DRAFT_333286 [Panus rudis PR-1116 ss-1]|nr:hypothetical protein K474DRAFT_333286 [Panus rudis PR-1116 ss-1]
MSCNTIPTATQFGTFTTDSLSTSFSTAVSTLPPTVTTILQTTCQTATLSGNATTTECSTSTSVSTIAGGTTTVTIPVTITVPITSSTPTATLFSTSCESGVTPNPGPTQSQSSGPSSDPASSAPSSIPPSSSLSVATSASTLPNGQVTTIEMTSTYLVTPTTTQLAPSRQSNNNITVPVAAGVGGGVGAIILILIIWWLFRRYRKNKYDIDLDDIKFPPMPAHHGPKDEVDLDGPLPEPYTYQPPGHNAPSGLDDMQHHEGLYGSQQMGYPKALQQNLAATRMGDTPGAGPSMPYNGYPSPSSPGQQSGVSPATTQRSPSTSYGPSHQAHPPLVVANPAPNSSTTYPPDIKSRTLFLRPEGYEMHGGGSTSLPNPHQQSPLPSGSSGSFSPSTAATTPPVVQHQDAGVVSPGPSARTPNSGEADVRRPAAGRSEKGPRPNVDADTRNDDPPPPAYSE